MLFLLNAVFHAECYQRKIEMSLIHCHTHFTLRSSDISILNLPEKLSSPVLDEKYSHIAIATEISNRTLFNLFLAYYCTFMEHLGISVVQVLVPLYIDKFDTSTLQLGLLFSAYSMMSSFAAVYMGRLSDKYGRRKMIIIAMSGTMTGLLLHGFAQNYYQFLACRFFTGAFGNKAAIVCINTL